MRLRQRDLKEIYLRRKLPKEDEEGTTYTDYDVPVPIKAKIQPAGGKVMVEMYGERLAYMMVMYYDGALILNEGDGLCIDVLPENGPDYTIKANRKWTINVYDLEKVV